LVRNSSRESRRFSRTSPGQDTQKSRIRNDSTMLFDVEVTQLCRHSGKVSLGSDNAEPAEI